MVMYLQGRRLVRAEDMAAHFEISVRTVYRDLAALSESGVPISGEPGVGYSLLKSYYLPPVMLTEEEASALFLGAEMAKRFADGSLRTPLDAAVLKLRAVLPRERQEFVDQMAKKTVIVGPHRNSGAKSGSREWLMKLQEAAVRRRVVQMSYRARTGEEVTTRRVEPLGVVLSSGVWYLVAWCRLRRSMRHFRLDRMLQVDLTQETFEPRPEFSLIQHLQSMPQEEMTPVRLRVSRCALERVRRESHVGVLEEKATPEGAEITTATYSLDWLAYWLLSFGGEAEALEPECLRQKVRDLAERVSLKHAESTEPQLV